MKSGQLIECNMEIFFFKNHKLYVVEKLVPDPFIKITIEHVSGSTVCNQFISTVCKGWGLPKYIKTKVLIICFYLIYWSPYLIFCMIFEKKKKKKKHGFKLYYIHRPNFFAGLLLLLKILGNTCFVTICCPVCDVINFEINRSFLTKLTFSYIIKKSKQKCKYLKNERNFYQEIKSVFHNF